jgi:hypothetical protein
VAARLVLGMSTAAVRVQNRMAGAAAVWMRRLSLDDPSVLASWVLLGSATALAGVWWYFSPLLAALSTRVSTAPLASHALLSPAFEGYQDRYWQTLSFLVLLTGLGWYAALRTAIAAGRSLNRGLLAGGAAVVVLAVGSLDFPYRLLVHNKFEAVRWKDADCYMIGERSDDALLFCPELPPPRNRVVEKADGSLERLGRRENIFTKSGGAIAGVHVPNRP